jgi:hypothetical protein
MNFRKLFAIASLAGLIGVPVVAAAQEDDPAGGDATGLYLGAGSGVQRSRTTFQPEHSTRVILRGKVFWDTTSISFPW